MCRNPISVKLSDHTDLLAAVGIGGRSCKSVGEHHRNPVLGPYLCLSQHVPSDSHCELECRQSGQTEISYSFYHHPVLVFLCIMSEHFLLPLSHARRSPRPALRPLLLPAYVQRLSLPRWSLGCAGNWAQLAPACGWLAAAELSVAELLPAALSSPRGSQAETPAPAQPSPLALPPPARQVPGAGGMLRCP